MIRTNRWKLVYSTGRRERKDGYATGRPPAGKAVRLYDLEVDPDEMTNLAGRAEHASLVSELTGRLAGHMRETMRHPEQIHADADVELILERCLAPAEEQAGN
jgi:choline-sulfatase